jgi:hypothetical protein
MGDGSDKIPRNSGALGRRPQLKLLEHYGSIESVLAHAAR